MISPVVSNLRFLENGLKQNTAKICNRDVLKMKIRRAVVFCDLSNTRLTVSA